MNRTAQRRRHESRRRLNRTPPPFRPQSRIHLIHISTEAGPDVTTSIPERTDPNDSLLTWLIEAINTVQSEDPTFQISQLPQEPETTVTWLDDIRNIMRRDDIFDRYLSRPIRGIDFNDIPSWPTVVEVESEDDQPKGLSEGTISKYLKTRSADEKDIDGDRKICAVCRDDMCGSQRDNKVAILDKCGHEFHYCCLEKWLRKKNICPLCRRTAIFPLQD